MGKEQYKPIIRWNAEYLRFEVSSERYAGHFYSIGYNMCYGNWECSCAWGRGRAKCTKKDCKHVIAVKEWLKDEANKAQVNLE